MKKENRVFFFFLVLLLVTCFFFLFAFLLSLSRLGAPFFLQGSSSSASEEPLRDARVGAAGKRKESERESATKGRSLEHRKTMKGNNNAPVTLVSSDGAEFVIDHDAACVSNTIKHMLASKGEEK